MPSGRNPDYVPLTTFSDPASSSQPNHPLHSRRHTTTTFISSVRIKRVIYLLPLVSISLLLIISLVTYLSPSRGYIRPCLPFSLSKLSSSAHRQLSCSALREQQQQDQLLQDDNAMSASPASKQASPLSGNPDLPPFQAEQGDEPGTIKGRLSVLLSKKKEDFLKDLKQGNVHDWTIVMGNEAGDLDSIASSVAFSVLSDALEQTKSIPLVLTPSFHMHLRPENILAFQRTNVSLSSFTHPDQLVYPPSAVSSSSGTTSGLRELTKLGATYALVDHNKLLPMFGDGEVVAVLDHHEDEGLYRTAAIRVVQVPTGSCATIVSRYWQRRWEIALRDPPNGVNPIPLEVASLLLMAIQIDTGNLKAGGKATKADYDSAEFLYPLSTFAKGSKKFAPNAPPEDFISAYKELADAKFNVGHLSTEDLLIRDYKEYTLPTANAHFPALRAGLSTVPLSLKWWLDRDTASKGWDNYLQDVQSFMAERNIDVEGVLTSWNNEKGKHKREIVLVTRSGASIPSPESAKKIHSSLIKGFEASEELALDTWKGEKNGVSRWLKPRRKSAGDGIWYSVWKQGNAKATRKQVAPILKDLVAGLN